jgi:ABC-type dipeptide/oligopeptide/nickel transport system permease component
MGSYILRRLVGSALVMLAVAALVFFMIRLVPGDPVAAMLADADSEQARYWARGHAPCAGRKCRASPSRDRRRCSSVSC